MNSIQCTLIVLCIVLVIMCVVTLQHTPSSSFEGYRGPVQPVQGTLPQIIQASYIPRDSATATTADPQLAKPDYRDWQDARDSLMYFLEIYNPNTIPPASKAAIGAMFIAAPRYLVDINNYIFDPEKIPSRKILAEAVEARRLADIMRRVGPADPYSVGWERPGCISHIDDDLLAL